MVHRPDLKNAKRKKAADQRQPPHSIEAEQGVLGCVFLSPTECLPDCATKLSLDSFYDLRHRSIYEALLWMYDHGVPIDIITVQQHLRDRKLLESVGGVAYLAGLPDSVPSAANLGYYIDIVRDKHFLRQTINICTDTSGRAYEHNGHDLSIFLEELGQDVNAVIHNAIQENGGVGVRSAKVLVQAAIQNLEHAYQNKGKVTGLCTGFHDFDEMTGGLKPGHMIVIAARTSVGKSSIAMNIADHVGCETKKPVGIFSLEMPAEDLMHRMICSRARVDSRAAASGFVKDDDFPKLTAAAGKIATSPIYIDDSRGLSILQLKAKARQMHQMYGIELLIIDYAQLVHSTNHRVQSRQEEVADVANGIQALAGELKIPFITLCQLNRDVEKRGGRPRLSDLRESGVLENNADIVALLYRVQEAEAYEIKSDAVGVNLLIAKHRGGPTGEIPLVFLKSYTRFESAVQHPNDPTENYPEPQGGK